MKRPLGKKAKYGVIIELMKEDLLMCPSKQSQYFFSFLFLNAQTAIITQIPDPSLCRKVTYALERNSSNTGEQTIHYIIFTELPKEVQSHQRF